MCRILRFEVESLKIVLFGRDLSIMITLGLEGQGQGKTFVVLYCKCPPKDCWCICDLVLGGIEER